MHEKPRIYNLLSILVRHSQSSSIEPLRIISSIVILIFSCLSYRTRYSVNKQFRLQHPIPGYLYSQIQIFSEEIWIVVVLII